MSLLKKTGVSGFIPDAVNDIVCCKDSNCAECNDFLCELNAINESSRHTAEIFLEEDYCKNWYCPRCGSQNSHCDTKCGGCNAASDEMSFGPFAHFGIIDDFDESKDYSSFMEGMSFAECLKKYHCIPISDDIINDWWDALASMKSYYHQFSRPETALARWGVTLIPPESLDLFTDIIINRTSAEFSLSCQTDIAALLNLLKQAKYENKFVIHYGV